MWPHQEDEPRESRAFSHRVPLQGPNMKILHTGSWYLGLNTRQEVSSLRTQLQSTLNSGLTICEPPIPVLPPHCLPTSSQAFGHLVLPSCLSPCSTLVLLSDLGNKMMLCFPKPLSRVSCQSETSTTAWDTMKIPSSGLRR